MDLFIEGLQAAGGNTSGPALIKGLASVKNWNEVGLLESTPSALAQRSLRRVDLG